MGFGQAISLFFKNYANFNGRSRRSEYWWVALLNVIIIGILAGIAIATGSFDPEALESGDIPPAMYLPLGLGVLWGLATLLPNISLFVRRLHDINLTGWIYLALVIIGFIPLIGLLGSIASIVIACIPGTAGPNKYGPDPKGGSSTAATTFS
jgi:uncharacterized membrane protein YhaH (DUF805 family)